MEFLKNSLLILWVSNTLACSQLRDKISRLPTGDNKTFQVVQLGELNTIDNRIVDLDDSSFDAVVIIFASDTCSTCATEAKYWVNELSTAFPTNILFSHYIIGGHLEDALDWQESLGIFWSVLISDNDDIYRQYCSAIITPCTLIKNNKTNEITRTYQPLRKEDLERYTGPWKN